MDKAWFTVGVKADSEKKISICPKLVINAEHYGPVLAPRLKKGYHQIWEANLQPFGPIIYCKGRRDEMKLPLNPFVIHPVICPVMVCLLQWGGENSGVQTRHGLFTPMGRRKQWCTDAANAQTRFRQ